MCAEGRFEPLEEIVNEYFHDLRHTSSARTSHEERYCRWTGSRLMQGPQLFGHLWKAVYLGAKPLSGPKRVQSHAMRRTQAPTAVGFFAPNTTIAWIASCADDENRRA